MKEDLKKFIEQNELIRMCKKHFDSETVKMGINELIDTFMLFIDNQSSVKEYTYQDVVDYLKTLPVNSFVYIDVMPYSENNNYQIEVFLDEDRLIIVGDFGQNYDWDELEITDIIK